MNKIEEYDQQIGEDISKFEHYVLREEELAREYMQIYGATEKVVNEVIQKARSEDRHISINGSASSINHLAKWLKEIAPVYKAFPFRVRLGHFMGTKMHIIMGGSSSFFNTCSLTDEERKEFAKHWNATLHLNYVSQEAGVYNWYPPAELMNFMAKMLLKYKAEDVLSEDEYYDEKMSSAWAWLEKERKREPKK